MAVDQLQLTNDALGILGERSLVTTTDATEAARTMLALWDHAMRYCLSQGHWTFAEREAVLNPSVTEVPTYGLANAFAYPTDYVRVNELASDEYFQSPIVQIHERKSHWYCDLSTLYLRYVSNDAVYGYDVTLWPAAYELYFTLYLATRASPRISPGSKVELLRSGEGVSLKDAKLDALSKDAVNGPTQFLPQGSWANSRGSRSGGRNSRSSLYGS